MSDKVISSTTQEFLDVYDIINDMVLLKDGTASIILQIGTMNFSLLAEQEQDAVIFTYGSLLNSLNYPIQINIQSQTKDATKYLRLLDEQVQKASSDRKATLIKQYRDFVATLIRERNVLQKRFYITVPASPGEMGMITPSGVLPGKTGFDASTVEKSTMLEKAMNVLEPRKDHLTAQFNRLGLFARQLTTQEIIQNFYINYNPEAAEGQEISSSENYATPLVRASFGKKFMPNDQSAPINPINPQGQVLQDLTTQSQALQSQIVASPEPSPADILSDQSMPEEVLSEISSPELMEQAVLPPETTMAPALDLVPGVAVDPTPQPTMIDDQPAITLAKEALPPVAPDFGQAPISSQTPAFEPTPIFEQTPAPQEQLVSLEQPVALEQPAVPEQAIVPEPPVTAEPPISQEVDLQLDANLLNNGQSMPVADQMPGAIMEPTANLEPVVEPVTEPVAEVIAPAGPIADPQPNLSRATVSPEVTPEPEAIPEPIVASGPIQSDFAEEITPLQRQSNFNAPPVIYADSADQGQNQLPEQQV